ncbi:EAL domain-containing protein [Methylophaga sp.]|uniref:EAL domain-containing protein n=1 Tax=Methylophaga sp. TaxID=2024840 RepID=UPI003F697AD1
MSDISFNEQFFAAQFGDLSLTTVFQPIFSIPHRKPVGYEGLVRAHDVSGRQVSPLQVFQRPQSSREHLELDRICRLLHARNFADQQDSDNWLFLNLNSQSLVTERPDAGFMNSLMSETGLTSRRIVIEILESAIDDRVYLKQLIKHFRDMGCLIAIDDFGAGHSNFDRIWELQPDLVKLDRSLVKEAAESLKVERILTGIISLIHEAGSLVIVEGVETEKEAMVAISSHADMVQGFYFARPNTHIPCGQGCAEKIDKLLDQQQNIRSQYNRKLQQHFDDFRQRYDAEIRFFEENKIFDQCGAEVFEDERVVRCYLLDEKGYQVGKSLYSPRYTAKLDLRFAPLLAGDSANWSHRHYHYRAIQSPGTTQISRPYLSVAGSHMCITVSHAMNIEGKMMVFCCDLDWPDEDLTPE